MNNQSVRKEYYSNDIIDEAADYLSTITDSPKLESEILLADILKTDRLDFYKSCLLYTSPSPRDGLLSRMPSSA